MSSVDFLADLGSTAEGRAVARVLSAATAPPWPHELRGYDAARRAFESAGAGAVSGTGAGSGTGVSSGSGAVSGAGAGSGSGAGAAVGGTPTRHGGRERRGARAGAGGAFGLPARRLIGVKLAAVAGALTVTGVAVAAEADVLPSPIQRAAHHVLGGVGVPDPDSDPRGGQTMASSPGASSGALGSSSGQHLAPNSQGGTDQGPGGYSSSGSSLPGTPGGSADTPGQSASTAEADVLALCRVYTAHQGNGGANGDGNGGDGLSDHDRHRLGQEPGLLRADRRSCAAASRAATPGGSRDKCRREGRFPPHDSGDCVGAPHGIG